MTERMIKAYITKDNIDDYDWDEITVLDGDINLAGYDKDFKPSALRVCGDLRLVDYYYDVYMPELRAMGDMYYVKHANIIETPLLTEAGDKFEKGLPSEREAEHRRLERESQMTDEEYSEYMGYGRTKEKPKHRSKMWSK